MAAPAIDIAATDRLVDPPLTGSATQPGGRTRASEPPADALAEPGDAARPELGVRLGDVRRDGTGATRRSGSGREAVHRPQHLVDHRLVRLGRDRQRRRPPRHHPRVGHVGAGHRRRSACECGPGTRVGSGGGRSGT
jgi:hypothetical protein